jgi:hypothetical protein
VQAQYEARVRPHQAQYEARSSVQGRSGLVMARAGLVTAQPAVAYVQSGPARAALQQRVHMRSSEPAGQRGSHQRRPASVCGPTCSCRSRALHLGPRSAHDRKGSRWADQAAARVPR